MRAVKGTIEGNESHIGPYLILLQASVAMSTVLYRIELTWKQPRRWIELAIQVTLPIFPPQTGLCARLKKLRRPMIRTLA